MNSAIQTSLLLFEARASFGIFLILYRLDCTRHWLLYNLHTYSLANIFAVFRKQRWMNAFVCDR